MKRVLTIDLTGQIKVCRCGLVESLKLFFESGLDRIGRGDDSKGSSKKMANKMNNCALGTNYSRSVAYNQATAFMVSINDFQSTSHHEGRYPMSKEQSISHRS
mmetsp:Transcript_308/g.1094  ORF Transcript_308/g.1094 Transcript_308/m.1094 type:complete len:103 (+) Transcript_308:3750-4058(+)